MALSSRQTRDGLTSRAVHKSSVVEDDEIVLVIRRGENVLWLEGWTLKLVDDAPNLLNLVNNTLLGIG